MTNARTQLLEHTYQRPGFLLRRAHQPPLALRGAMPVHGDHAVAEQSGILAVLASAGGLETAVDRLAGAGFRSCHHAARRAWPGRRGAGRIGRRRRGTVGKLALSLTAEGVRVLEMARRPAERAFELLLEPLEPQATAVAH